MNRQNAIWRIDIKLAINAPCPRFIVTAMGHGNRPVKIRPVIFGLLLYVNEVWRHIFQILKNTTGH